MTGLPTSDWVAWEGGRKAFPEMSHISAMNIRQNKNDDNSLNMLKIRHIFTHFDLELRGVIIKLPPGGFTIGENQFWVAPQKIAELGLPTVFRKFTRLMQPASIKTEIKDQRGS